MKTSNASLLISTAVSATTLLGAPSAYAQQAQGTRNSLTLEEVIVTAQKRQEALQDVAQSVTVLTNATLERQQADNLQDYLALIPGLSMEGSTRGVSRITLRGINTGGVASTVGVSMRYRSARAVAWPTAQSSPAISTPSTWRGWKCCAVHRARCTAPARSAVS
jgi:outer membrane receptor protein involved in Fe transport